MSDNESNYRQSLGAADDQLRPYQLVQQSDGGCGQLNNAGHRYDVSGNITRAMGINVMPQFTILLYLQNIYSKPNLNGVIYRILNNIYRLSLSLSDLFHQKNAAFAKLGKNFDV